MITALGSAIASAIATAGELKETNVGDIIDTKTYFSPLTAENSRNVARVEITVQRNPDWKPDEADINPNRRRAPQESQQPLETAKQEVTEQKIDN